MAEPGVEPEDVRRWRVGTVERLLVVEGRRTYARDDAFWRWKVANEGDNLEGSGDK